MYYKINSLNVINANLLSCPYTVGFSLAAFKGLVDFLSIKTQVHFTQFAIIVNELQVKSNENIVRDNSLSTISVYKKNTQSILTEIPSILQDRYFDFSIDLILFSEAILEKSKLCTALNLSKIQSGIVQKEVNEKHILAFEDDIDKLKFISNNNPLSYLISDASCEIDINLSILDQFAFKLAQKNSPYMAICNGYKKIKDSDFKRYIEPADETLELNTEFVEPNLILARCKYVRDIKSGKDNFKNCFFQDDPIQNYYIVSAKN